MHAETQKGDNASEVNSSQWPDTNFIGDEWYSANRVLIEITIDRLIWQPALLEDLKTRGPFMLDHIASTLSMAPPTISLLLCGDAQMRDMNRQHRGFDKPTNVLSFPSGDDWPADLGAHPSAEMLSIGDIAIAGETVLSEANDGGITSGDHLLHLFTHGVLHLLGYDHIDDVMAEEMETLEASLLAMMNVANPYADTGMLVGTREAR